jgi:hypothetical protein
MKRAGARRPDDTTCPVCGQPQRGTAKGCMADALRCRRCEKANEKRLKALLAPGVEGPGAYRKTDADE